MASEVTSQITGAQSLVKSLEAAGVDVMFGLPGGAILPAYDPIYDSKIRHILVRHEQGAGHAAEGYAQVTGRAGVCIATSGPGATNLVTPLADAAMDSVPVVAITGQVPGPAIGTDAFQEADIRGITMPFTKHNFLITDADEIPSAVAQAFHIATTGRPGPVLVDIAKDALQKMTTFNWPKEIKLAGYRIPGEPDSQSIADAAALIAESKKPVFYVGGGVIKSDAARELRQFATTFNIPVVTTLQAIGAFDTTHPLALHMLGMHGTAYANYAVEDCDFLIAVGARFDDRVTGKVAEFAPNATNIAHLDVDATEVGKVVRVTWSHVADARTGLQELLAAGRGFQKDFSVWVEHVREL